MRNLFSLIVFIGLFTQIVAAQTIQWASEVINVSSQYEDDYYAAKQALGVPNALMNRELHYMAWVPKKEDSSFGEHLQVGFQTPMKIQQVAVAESHNPGAIIRIKAIDKNGKSHTIYENKKPKGTMESARIFRHKFPLTEYYVKELRLELHTSAVPGSNQIDAIGISDSDEDIKSRVSLLRYKEEVEAPESLGTTINSNFPERLPIISTDGQTLFFARKQHPKNMGAENKDDIWLAYRQKDDTWSQAQNIDSPLNNDDHNFVVASNPSGEILFLGNDYDKNQEGISITQRKGNTWSKPKAIKIEDHYNDSEFVGYHVNVDGDVLLMSVERKEGLGDRDFYVSFKRRDGWTKPQNLGKTINTVSCENSIFLAADNRTIYFSSNGHPGYGGFDMFVSKRLDNTWTKWSKPKNLGKKINTKQNDFNYTIPASGEYAYFSSGSMENSDLYRIKLPQEVQPDPVALITAKIVDDEGNPIDGKLNIQKIGKKYKKTRSEEEDKHQLVFRFGDNIGIHAEKEGYFSSSENIALAQTQLQELDGESSPPKARPSATKDEPNELQIEIRDLKKDIASLERERKNTKPVQVRPSSKNDPELQKLKQKYNRLLGVEEPATAQEAVAETTQPQSNGDSELDAMKRRYNQHYNQEESKPSSSSKPKRNPSSNNKKDDELAAMKERFNKHYGEEDEEPIAEKPQEKPSSKKEESAPAEIDFEAYQEEVRQELIAELTPEIREELQEELYTETKQKLDEQLREQLQPDIEKDIRQQLQKNIEEDVKNELRQENESSVREALTEELRDEIEADLRKTLQPQLEAELRRQLTKKVKDELRLEMEYAAKKELQEALKTELEQQKDEPVQSEIDLPKLEDEEAENTEPAYKEVEKEIVLIPIKVGQVIPMNNIFFDANKSSLKEASYTELERVLDFLNANPSLVVEVGGHTNGWCSSEFAHELSTDRAKVVMDFFKQKGVPVNRVQHRGYGKTKPIASNDTKTGRRKNQRVELKILEIL